MLKMSELDALPMAAYRSSDRGLGLRCLGSFSRFLDKRDVGTISVGFVSADLEVV